jgi:3-hydroxy-9,10-secoandrosta-1,3,5(10)-triene-9,17-dione monooxygenase
LKQTGEADVRMTKKAPDKVAYLDHVSRLRAPIEAHQAEGESQGWLPRSVIGAMREAGLFRMLQPTHFGGAECDPATFFSVQMALSQIDMSAGWLHGVMGVLAFHLALFDMRAQRDVWGDAPDALMASSYMPRGTAVVTPEGYRLSGKWSYASGADHADWLLLGGIVKRDSAEGEMMVFLIPRRDAEILGTWDTTGLRATGSQDIVVRQAVVRACPTHTIRDRFMGRSAGLSVNRAALYRIPLPQMLFRVISSPAIGGLQGLLDALLAHNRARIAVTGAAVSKNPVVQLACAEAAAEIDEMQKTMTANFERLLDYGRRGVEAPIEERMLHRLQATMVAERCCRMASRLFKASGASGLSQKKPFGRFLKDIEAARQHIANQYEPHGEALGARMLGIEIEDTLL